MFTLNRPRRWTAWLAMWVLVFNALAPLVAQATVARQTGNHWVEVCTSTGMVRVQSDAGPEAPSGDPFSLGQHCPACTLHDMGLGLPASEFSVRALPLPVGFVSAVPLTVWDNRVALAAPARAPPRF